MNNPQQRKSVQQTAMAGAVGNTQADPKGVKGDPALAAAQAARREGTAGEGQLNDEEKKAIADDKREDAKDAASADRIALDRKAEAMPGLARNQSNGGQLAALGTDGNSQPVAAADVAGLTNTKMPGDGLGGTESGARTAQQYSQDEAEKRAEYERRMEAEEAENDPTMLLREIRDQLRWANNIEWLHLKNGSGTMASEQALKKYTTPPPHIQG